MKVDLKNVRLQVEKFLHSTLWHYSADAIQNMEYEMAIGQSGKGSVFGSIFIIAVWWPRTFKEQIQKLRLDENYVLQADKGKQKNIRKQFLELINLLKDKVIFYESIELTASQISQNMNNMLENYNLNELIFQAVDKVSKTPFQKGFKVTHIFSKCFGQKDKELARMKLNLQQFNQTIKEIKIESKADGTSSLINMANLIARASNEKTLDEWKFNQQTYFDQKFGSGGTNDQVTIKWLHENKHHIFGYPNIVRFPWKTVSNCLTGTLIMNVKENYDEQKTLKSMNITTSNKKEREKDLWSMVTEKKK